MTSVIQYIEDNVVRVPESGCWLWPRDTKTNRPRINIGGRNVYLHRLVLEFKLGRPLEAQANHTCDVGCCVNPNHLYEGTQSENIADAFARGRIPAGGNNWGRV